MPKKKTPFAKLTTKEEDEIIDALETVVQLPTVNIKKLRRWQSILDKLI